MKSTDSFICCVLIFLSFLTYSCSSYVLEEETQPDKNDHKVQFAIKGNEISPSYPMRFFIFNADGSLNKSFTKESEKEPLECGLPEGNYSAFVLSGTDTNEFTIPDNPSSKSAVLINKLNYSKSPLVIGTCLMEINKDAHVSFGLKYGVAKLRASISSVPQNAEEMTISLSPVCSGITMEGNYTDDKQTATISCYKSNDVWTSGDCYLLPSTGSKTVISFNIKFAGHTQSFSHTLTSGLEAQGVYNIDGEYTGNNNDASLELNGEFEIGGWKEAVDMNLKLEEGTLPDDNNFPPENEETENGDTIVDNIVTEGDMPEAQCIWGNFFVWKTEPVAQNQIMATLITLDQKKSLAADARINMVQMNIDGITGWRFPTKEEAIELTKQYYGDELNYINQFFIKYGCPIFKHEDGDRYLCDDGKTTFCFYSHVPIRQAKRPLITIGG